MTDMLMGMFIVLGGAALSMVCLFAGAEPQWLFAWMAVSFSFLAGCCWSAKSREET